MSSKRLNTSKQITQVLMSWLWLFDLWVVISGVEGGEITGALGSKTTEDDIISHEEDKFDELEYCSLCF